MTKDRNRARKTKVRRGDVIKDLQEVTSTDTQSMLDKVKKILSNHLCSKQFNSCLDAGELAGIQKVADMLIKIDKNEIDREKIAAGMETKEENHQHIHLTEDRLDEIKQALKDKNRK